MTRWILHVDLGQFLAAVDDPAYSAVSAEVMAVLRETGRPVEVLGRDEAFVVVWSDDPEDAARGIIADVRAATGLGCSVGIGQNKLQAKIATGFGKQAGVFRLTSGNWFGLLGPRPPDAIWGISAKTAAKLAAVGITTVRELAAADARALAAVFGPATGPWLVLAGNGRGEREVDPTPYVPRSHGREITFGENLDDWGEVRSQVAAIARQVASEISERIVASVVVKIRYAPFVTVTHGVGFSGASPDGPVPDLAAFEAASLEALEMFEPGRPVRLLGVRAEFGD